MSSHKEAPGIANDAAADNTDVYAFVSPDDDDTVTLIANFVPLQNPAGGPNFYEFGEDVLYEIRIDNNGDGVADVTYQFRFDTQVGNPNTFLYNTGTIETIDDDTWNRKQFYSVTKIGGTPMAPANNLPCPPCNVGPASTPNYADLAAAAIQTLPGGQKVFAGQRAEGFYVDLGAVFNLGILRPFLDAHLVNMPKAPGVNATRAVNINSIAIQVPKADILAVGADGTTVANKNNIIGVYARASRQRSLRYNTNGTKTPNGAFVQISRQANPLVNEVLNKIPQKDRFNANDPIEDNGFVQDNVLKPELAGLLGALYPGVFPNLGKYTKPRNDLLAVLLTGVPAGIVPGFPGNYPNAAAFPGPVRADLLRLNVAIPPKTNNPSNLGLLGGDIAGFPNGRRVFDDVTTIELRAIAGAILPLVDNTFTSDAAAGAITPGLTSSNTDVTAKNTVNYLSTFPYLGTPHSGYRNPSNNAPAPDLGVLNQPPSNSGPIPSGAPETGVGPTDGLNKGLLAGSVAMAGAAVAGTLAVRARPAEAAEPARRPRPQPEGT